MPTESTPQPASRFRGLLPALGAGLPVFLLGLLVHRQGFNFLDDGLWLLGGDVIADGGRLYRDLFTIYGPARYLLLLPCFLIVGRSALALVLLKAAVDGLAAGIGFRFASARGAGRLAWLVPLGVAALGPLQPRYLAVGALAVLLAGMTRAAGGRRREPAAGLLWGLTWWFGLDAALFSSLVVAVWWLARDRGAGGPSGRRLLPGFLAAVLGPLPLLALPGAAPGSAWWDLVIYPLTRFAAHLHVSWLTTFADAAALGRPFADLKTGEVLPAVWPLHQPLRTLALRLLLLGAWIVPAAAAWLGLRRRRDPALAPVLALAAAGWVVLAGRGDVDHLRVAWLGSLWLLPGLLASAGGRRGLQAGLLAVVVLAWSPLLGEKLWLAAHSGRETVARWERPRARILMAPALSAGLDDLAAGLPPEAGDGCLIWPNQPGLHFLLDLPPAVAQVTLLAGEVRSEEALAAALVAARPAAFVQGRSWGVLDGVFTVQDLAPRVWSQLRRSYRVDRVLRVADQQYRICSRRPPGPGEGRPQVTDSLPLAEQMVTGGLGPVMTPGLPVGQSFRSGPDPLQGISLRWVQEGPAPLPVPLRLEIRALDAAGRPQPRSLGAFDLTITLPPGRRDLFLGLPGLPRTADRALLITVAVREPLAVPVRLCLAAPLGAERSDDHFRGGSAWVDGRPVAGDLTFTLY